MYKYGNLVDLPASQDFVSYQTAKTNRILFNGYVLSIAHCYDVAYPRSAPEIPLVVFGRHLPKLDFSSKNAAKMWIRLLGVQFQNIGIIDYTD